MTFEDILEEVVGEIYDEDDDEEQAVDSKEISKDQNSGVFTMRGSAELSMYRVIHCSSIDMISAVIS